MQDQILSPKPMYSPRRNKLKLDETAYEGHHPIVTVSTLNHSKFSPIHSVASLNESISTADSGFNSVIAAQPLVPSPNSAFSPRFSSHTKQNSLNDTLPISPNSDAASQSSRTSLTSETTSVEPSISSILAPTRIEMDQRSIVSEPIPRGSRSFRDDASDSSSYVYTRGRQRYRPDPNRSTLMIDTGPENRSLSRDRYRTRAELKRLEDRKSLFAQFIAQAEERDKQVRTEKEAVEKACRLRSVSRNRTPKTIAPIRSVPKRSSSVDSSAKPQSGRLRRSSSVNIQDMITKAERRDRNARVEQARLEGLVPPRRYLDRKDSIKTGSAKSTSSIINELQNKTKTNSTSSNSSPEKTESSKISPTRTHRKFKTFMTSSRLARPDGYQHHSRYGQNVRYESGHSTRSSTWNGSDLRSYVPAERYSKADVSKSKRDYAADGKSDQLLFLCFACVIRATHYSYSEDW